MFSPACAARGQLGQIAGENVARVLNIDDEHQDLLGTSGIRIIQPVLTNVGEVGANRRAEQIDRLLQLADVIGSLFFLGHKQHQQSVQHDG